MAEFSDIARECGGIRSGSFEPVKRWTFTEDGLAAFAARLQRAGTVAELTAEQFDAIVKTQPSQPWGIGSRKLDALNLARAVWALAHGAEGRFNGKCARCGKTVMEHQPDMRCPDGVTRSDDEIKEQQK